MYRKLLCAVVVAGFAAGLAVAQNAQNPASQANQAVQPGKVDKNSPLWGRITKVQGNTVYFSQYDPVTKKFGPAKEYPVTDTDLPFSR